MDLDVHRLRALVALAETGTVTAAAEALHYGQSTITHHLHQLQVETGTVLFQRVGRGIKLTPEGVRLAAQGAEILGLLSRAQADLESASALREGRLRLAVFPSAIATLIPPLLKHLHAHAPGVRLDLVEAEPPQALDLLSSGAVDLALAFSYPPQVVPSRFNRTDLFEDPLFLVTQSTAPLESVAAGGMSRWVTGCEQCRSELLAICDLHGVEPDIAMATDDYVAVQALVASGYGITILPRLALDSYRHPKVKTIEIPGHARTVMVVGLGAPPLPALQVLVIELLQECVAER